MRSVKNLFLGGLLLAAVSGCSDPQTPNPQALGNVSVDSPSGSGVCGTRTPSPIPFGENGALLSGATLPSERTTAGVGCTVQEQEDGTFVFNGRVSTPNSPQATVSLAGTVTYTEGTVGSGTGNGEASAQSPVVALTTQDCVYTVHEAKAGSIWLTYLCKNARDPSSSSASCDFSGSMVWENCKQ